MRAVKLTEVSEKLKITVKNLNTAQKEYEKALCDYQLVEQSFDLNERVYVCDIPHYPMINKSRYLGCGTIVKVHDEYLYDVKMDDKFYGTLKKIRYNFLTRKE